MSVFDPYIEKVAHYVAGLRESGEDAREFSCRGSPGEMPGELPVRVGANAHRGIILRSDTYLELGNPLAGSCAFVLWTENVSLVKDGRVTLVGPDIPESAEGTFPSHRS